MLVSREIEEGVREIARVCFEEERDVELWEDRMERVYVFCKDEGKALVKIFLDEIWKIEDRRKEFINLVDNRMMP